MRRLIFVVAVIVSLKSQATPKSKASQAPGKTTVHFDGDTIDGDLMRPDGDLMAGRAEISMPNLVQPPGNFDRASRKTLLAAAACVEKPSVKTTAERGRQSPPMNLEVTPRGEGNDARERTRSTGSAR